MNARAVCWVGRYLERCFEIDSSLRSPSLLGEGCLNFKGKTTVLLVRFRSKLSKIEFYKHVLRSLIQSGEWNRFHTLRIAQEQKALHPHQALISQRKPLNA